ncbi:MAG: MG2 domain-containing protein [Lautropia sp.]|nr:MG2 domain-containing protein [Lautropia sp.]
MSITRSLRCSSLPGSLLVACSLLWLHTSALALSITSVSPEGEVSRVRQVVVKFDGPATRLGDPQAPAPFTLHCDSKSQPPGSGRWTNEREWVYDLETELPGATRCQLNPIPTFRTPDGSGLKQTKPRHFNTPGPQLQRSDPVENATINEDQTFIFQLSAPAATSLLQQKIWCRLPGLGERVPARILQDDERHKALKKSWLGRDSDSNASKQTTDKPHDVAGYQQLVALQCQRRLSPGSTVGVIIDQGLRSPNGIVSSTTKRIDFRVREAFRAEMSCERENAQSPCLPIRPISLNFSAPVPLQVAAQVKLSNGSNMLRPVFAFPYDEEEDEFRAATPEELQGQMTYVERLRFEPPFVENTNYVLSLPNDIRDDDDRPLDNAGRFPITISTGTLPPLAKFASAPFGIIERFAEGPAGTPILPVTLRNVESMPGVSHLQLSQLSLRDDTEIIDWYRKVVAYDAAEVERKAARKDVNGTLPPSIPEREYRLIESRTLSLLNGKANVETRPLPGTTPGSRQPLEVLGIPLKGGVHVLEIASSQLGASLLDPAYGPGRQMFVRTMALVTNLSVHFKRGHENSLAWVTSLDDGKPVAGAQVRVSSCEGKEIAQATTDANGIARFDNLPPDAPICDWTSTRDPDSSSNYFISARLQKDGVEDMAFVWSHWQRGIEPWRFQLTEHWRHGSQENHVHTIMDRTLLRAGETVSMKHFVRAEQGPKAGNLSLPARDKEPDTLTITHTGSGQEFQQPLQWWDTASGGRTAISEFRIPKAARLGEYRIALGKDGYGRQKSGSFRVEEFRLPLFQGSIGIGEDAALIAPSRLPVNVGVSYIAGGPAERLPVQISAVIQGKLPEFPDHPGFVFNAPERYTPPAPKNADKDPETFSNDAPDGVYANHVIADKRPLTLNAEGTGSLALDVPPFRYPHSLIVESSHADPNGEIQTLRHRSMLWPAAVVAGIRTEDWISVGKRIRVQALALDTNGKAKANVPLRVLAIGLHTTTARKRAVGGLYAYESQTHQGSATEICSGKSDAHGLLECEAETFDAGSIELVVEATDNNGRKSHAAMDVWVTRLGEIWFGPNGESSDRMDLIPEKKDYAPGETARFQVRMPFRQATALISVEREGIIHTEVQEIRGDDPTVSLKIGRDWTPNVYVSVLALRGRLHDVPWYSFFDWGWKSPAQWWRSWRQDNTGHAAPTALVDLSKPAFRLGVTEIRVNPNAHRLDVKVSADKPHYPVRGTAQIDIEVKRPDGTPAAHAEVAIAAVDQALLELKPNRSWAVLEAMLSRRDWNVSTATAQMEIVGRRHYGRKAVAAGGDGGEGGPQMRELLDTLLLWKPRVTLDANGRARIAVPLNDSISTFRVVAMADHGSALFGTGTTHIRTRQDLQIISGLPPLVRADDQYRASITLRNNTAEPMTLRVTPRATLLQPAERRVSLAAGEAREIHWGVTAPAALADTNTGEILWEIEAVDEKRGIRDALKIQQRILHATPLSVQQATIRRVEGELSLPASRPASALPDRGGLQIDLQPSLGNNLPGVKAWLQAYPYSCLEQQSSKAIGLHNVQHWQSLIDNLSAYLDEDGLAHYFPPAGGSSNNGSDTLTAWMLATSHEASRLDPAFSLPAELRAHMIEGLTRFVQGNIQRKHWSPREDLDMRKLAAIEALSRYGAAKASMLQSLRIQPEAWPTGTLIDWIDILKRVKGIPDASGKLREAMRILRSRLSWQGGRLVFQNESNDHWWWLMLNGDVNAARLLLTVLEDPAWQNDLPRLVTGLLDRQKNGAWQTTTANAWGWLAMQHFSKIHEQETVSGKTTAHFGKAQFSLDWSQWEADKTRTIPSGTTRTGLRDVLPLSSHDGRSGKPLIRPESGQFILPWPEHRQPQSAAHGQTSQSTTALPANARQQQGETPHQGRHPENASDGKTSDGKETNTLRIRHSGNGKPWASVLSLAAVPRQKAFNAGYTITRTVTPVQQARNDLPPNQYSRGDVLRVELKVKASAPMTWVAVTDPIPAGATILGSGLGRDSEIASQEKPLEDRRWPDFTERSFEAFRAYYQYAHHGEWSLQYTLRLNNPGTFQMPASRVEALYAPEMFGELPNAPVTVNP